MKFLSILGIGLILSAAPVRAELLGYWDFNADNLVRSAGLQGTLDIVPIGFELGEIDDFGFGTDVNLLPGFEEGDSKSFFSLAEIDETTQFVISGLDFTGYVSPVISFAARNDAAFQMGDELYLEYNIGSGWVRAHTFADPGDDFTPFSFTFSSGVLDNVANVSLRFAQHTGISLVDEFEVDNIQINATAVPEPSTVALATMGGLALIGGLLRRRAARP